MGNFKHHKEFSKHRDTQRFLFPHVCIPCRKSVKKPASSSNRVCSQCGQTLVRLSRKFAAPKARDIAQWKKIEFLVNNGFLFYSAYERIGEAFHLVPYPKTLVEAREFVKLQLHGFRK